MGHLMVQSVYPSCFQVLKVFVLCKNHSVQIIEIPWALIRLSIQQNKRFAASQFWCLPLKTFLKACNTLLRTHRISGLKSQVLKHFWLKTDVEKWSRIFHFEILLAPWEMQLLTCQANSASLGRILCTGQQQLKRG